MDIAADLLVVLLEINPDSGSITGTYVYANGQIIAKHNGDYTTSRYFYLHDRLGSVRQIIDSSGSVKKFYTYEPFGKVLEQGGLLINPFMFTGQWYDSEIGEYHLRARQYDPYISRFTSRDPVAGSPLILKSFT